MATKLTTIIADFQTQLASKIAVGATSMVLQSALDDDGTSLPSGEYCFTIDKNNSSKEYLVGTLSGSAVTALKNVTRQGVQASGAVREHRTGATIEITDFADLKYIGDILKGDTQLDSTAPLEYDGTVTPTLANQIASKSYVDSVAIAGGADASTTVKGISKLSTAPASATDPISVGDNDPRVPTADENDALVGTSGTAVSASNKLVDAADVTEAKTASKIARRDSNSDILVATTPTAGDAAASKDYVDAQVLTVTPQYANGVTGRASVDGAGSVVIAHGLTGTPDVVKVSSYGTTDRFSYGTWDGSYATVHCGDGSIAPATVTDSIAYVYDTSGGEVLKATVSVDSTNITLTWSAPLGSYSGGDIKCVWEAIIL